MMIIIIVHERRGGRYLCLFFFFGPSMFSLPTTAAAATAGIPTWPRFAAAEEQGAGGGPGLGERDTAVVLQLTQLQQGLWDVCFMRASADYCMKMRVETRLKVMVSSRRMATTDGSWTRRPMTTMSCVAPATQTVHAAGQRFG